MAALLLQAQHYGNLLRLIELSKPPFVLLKCGLPQVQYDKHLRNMCAGLDICELRRDLGDRETRRLRGQG